MKNSFDNPLSFFEEALNTNFILDEIERTIYFYDFHSYNIQFPNLIKYIEQNEDGEFIKGEIKIQQILLPKFRNEFNNAKELMQNIYLDNDTELNKSFLIFQFNSLQDFINKNTSLINQLPLFLLPIRGLVNYINDKLLIPGMDKFELKEDNIDNIPFNDSFNITKSNNSIIHSVLDYFRGENEKKVIILNEEDFDLLIKYTTYLIEEEKLPNITKRIKPELTNELIRFTFWVLHNELYTTRGIRPYFYDFIKKVFKNFDNTEISSIKKIFAVKSRIFNDDFIPEVISKHLQK